VLNWAVRYYPILRVLRQHRLLDDGTLLEIGSGPRGIGTYRKVPFTGCDLALPEQPHWPMTPMVGSATNLPLPDKSFDVVLASDMLEHVPPTLRRQVIGEALRVARRLVIFGFPCGEAAHDEDEALKQWYLDQQKDVPVWLEEHMEAEFPEPSLFSDLPGWNVDQFGNESIRFHSWLIQREVHRNFVRVTGRLARWSPWLMEPLIRRADAEPYYRQIFVLSPADQA
jgi:hypothetical protein